jgi:hypothetical protein
LVNPKSLSALIKEKHHKFLSRLKNFDNISVIGDQVGKNYYAGLSRIKKPYYKYENRKSLSSAGT